MYFINKFKQPFIYIAFLSNMLVLIVCTTTIEKNTMLELMKSDETGVDFRNDVFENLNNNILAYTNFYNGAGVAVGDINNDGLVDIYLNANNKTGKLYLNKGNFKFKDITKNSGLDTISGWKTGVTMVDINQDGLLDIYICRSGNTKPKLRSNLLFVNNGNQTFTEKGKEYGLDDWSTSLQATFFDYDLDGDLDMFLLNHAINPIREIFKNFHDKDINRYTGDKLFKNENGYFNEVKEYVGINRSKLGDGLGVAITDFNNDNYPDIYVDNDFAGRDYLYFNNGNGTFNESALQSMAHISYSSMGNDAADIDNDGWQDLFVLDMRSSTNYGRKTNMASMNPEAFKVLTKLDGHYQYMRNTLQLNNGNKTFSDIAPMAGVASTDWSWSPLFVDLDNDGYKDLFITNGMRKNTNNKDFVAYKKERLIEESEKKDPDYEAMIKEVLENIPVEKVVNQVYKNLDGLTFEKRNEDWGITTPSYSNGSAYADFDNDGDMDLIINNIDQEVHIYRNNATQLNTNHFVKIKLQGNSFNLNGIGAKVMVQTSDKKQYIEQQVSRGFESSVDFILHFGLGQSNIIDLLKVTWPDGKVSKLKNVAVDKMVFIDYNDAVVPAQLKKEQPLLFSNVTDAYKISHRHVENDYDDFKNEVLLPHKMSTFGPALAVGDINKDGLDDFFIGGSKGFEGAIYIQNANKSFTKTSQKGLTNDKFHEDIDAIFFDADQDGDLDLYVVSGGNEMPIGDIYYQDRLYINNGKGHFTRLKKALPKIISSGGVVRAHDFDNDGDLDLFIGGRLQPGQYPKTSRSYLLENTNGKFIDITVKKAKDLLAPGMITDAIWSDYDGDGQKDLVIVGEWMPITIFKNNHGEFTKLKDDITLNNSNGWWFSIQEGDINNNGRMDYIVGNLGLNYKYKANPDRPFKLFSKDFDKNGSLDIVLSYYENDTLYPLRGKECSTQQIPKLKKKFQTYDAFGLSSLNDIYEKDSLNSADLFEAKTFSSSILFNTPSGFKISPLPKMAQMSAIFGIIYDDFDKDGINDIVVAGNLYNSEIETPRGDAGQGLFLKGDGMGGFIPVRGYNSGLFISGDVKKIKPINLGNSSQQKKGIISGVNNDYIKLIKVQ